MNKYKYCSHVCIVFTSSLCANWSLLQGSRANRGAKTTSAENQAQVSLVEYLTGMPCVMGGSVRQLTMLVCYHRLSSLVARVPFMLGYIIWSLPPMPEKTLEVTQDKPKEDRVNITCEAEGVYPEPNMTITALESKHTGFIQVTTRKQNNSSLFDIKGTLSVDDVELSSPTTFVCELSIPDANYSNRRELVYFPGPPTTPSVSDHIAESLPSSGGKIGGGRVARLRPCTL
ncbi:hypothetical protein J6590_052656 [Homalodisca vitripennis]|nr:hypothetical protein J6590_052656 [Homalodisca vitripennis]